MTNNHKIIILKYMLNLKTYGRNNAVNYALEYALKKNPEYFDYTLIGGNCTNFVSQCIFAGAPKMNFDANNGWYYLSPANTSISWANVEPLFNFLTTNKAVGPFASNSAIELCEIGDIIQLRFSGMQSFSHSLVVTKIQGYLPKDIFICANTRDVKNVPLSSYNFAEYRLLHILGYRVNE